MGFEINSTNLLLYALKTHENIRAINNVLTLGRQNVLELPKNLKFEYKKMEYAEDFINSLLPWAKVDSIDISSYENATYVADLGKELPSHLVTMKQKYDLVIDFGTLDHLYNIPKALFNASSFLKEKGTILHALCANNWINHGFYQISPDLFYSVYSEKNGYVNTEVFLANCNDNKHFYKVNKSIGTKRATAEGPHEAYVLSISRLGLDSFSHSEIYQGSWEPKWNSASSTNVADRNKQVSRYMKLLGSRFPKTRSLYVKFYEFSHWKVLSLFKLEKINRRNRNLKQLKVIDLIS